MKWVFFLLLAYLTLLPTGRRGAQQAPPQVQPAPPAMELPPGFAETVVATGLTGATGLAVAPDGRVFVCEQTGALRVVKDDRLLPTPFVTVPVDSFWERGLIGVTLDPDFPKNGLVYVCYVTPHPYPHHRISRFTARGDVAVPGSEVILFEGDDQRKLGGGVPAGHQGGGLHFGKDGKLYVGIGEHTNSPAAQRLDTLQGKLLRLNPDGSIPADNPFYTKARGKYRATWAIGLRNPFAFAVQPGTGRIFINDVGDARWEEINEGVAGANYGWPHSEGPTTDRRFRGPLYAYDHGQGQSITGGTFYNPPIRQFPAEYLGKYFFADYMANWIRVLDPDDPRAVTTFSTGLAGPVDLQVTPDGSLYCLNRNAWVKDGAFKPHTGSLHRIRYVAGSGQPLPRIARQPDERTVAPGQSATFQVTAAGAGPLQYQWLRNGKPLPGAVTPSYTIPSPGAADQGARFQCMVSNNLGRTRTRSAALWLTDLRPATQSTAVLPGLQAEYFEGRWDHVPDLAGLTPTATGTASTFDLSPRLRDEDFALVERGFLQVPRDGAYTFSLTASGAGRLFVAGAEVAVTGPGSSPREHSGAVGLRAGRHPVLLLLAHGKGRPILEVRYSGPGVGRQQVPASALSHADPAALVAPVIEPAGGTFSGLIQVRLTTTTAKATIHYTTDGTPPTADSPTYRGPFALDKSATVTARAFPASGTGSQPTTASFRIEGQAPYGLPFREPVTTLNVPADPAELPPRLSQTGVFASLADLSPGSGVVPYGVNAPLWGDGAAKRRWIALPGNAQVGFAPTGEWKFPAGTVLIKHFEIGVDETDPSRRRRLETRLLVVDRAGLGYGVTYRWRPDGSDADLLPAGLGEDIPVRTARGSRLLHWNYPSRHDCLVCHTPVAGFVLGVTTRQLNGPLTYSRTGVTDNQLRTWRHLGLFANPPNEKAIPHLRRLVPVTDQAAPLEQRVRSYLDSNCAQCHRPGGARAEFDARLDTPLQLQKLIGGPLIGADLGVPGARVVTPGAPERSMIYLRMSRRQGVFNMPPLATNVVDADAVAAVAAWIRSLPAAAHP
jgi:uncharacterized repeat protein (TIGR03806 family)